MRALEIITELFKDSAPFKWAFKGSEEAFAKFTVEGVPYLFHAYNSPSKPRSWEVEFSMSSESALVGGRKQYGVTGTGNAAAVMSTVVNIMREFINAYKDRIDSLKFTADENSRTDLYARMVQRLLPTWNMSRSANEYSGTNFVLTSPDVVSEDSYQPPTLHTGDKILKGKFKNSPAEIKGFKKDKHNQPVLKTNKGDVQLFKPRVTKLMKEEVIDEYEQGTDNSRQIFAKLKSLGYKKLGSGQDATVWSKDESSVIKILMPSRAVPGPAQDAERGFLTFYAFCQQYPDNPNLPKFIDIGGSHHTVFELNGIPYRQIAMEKLQPIKNGSFEEAMVWMLSDLAKIRAPWPNIVDMLKKPESWAIEPSMSKMPELVSEKLSDPVVNRQYGMLYITMGRLYNVGLKAGLGWDLHTENAMMRPDGTIVIVDPYYT